MQKKEGESAKGLVASEWLCILQFDILPHFLLAAVQKAGRPDIKSVQTLTEVVPEWNSLCKQHALRMGVGEEWFRIHFPFQVSADWAPVHCRGKSEMCTPRVSMFEEVRTLWQRALAFLGQADTGLLCALQQKFKQLETAAFDLKAQRQQEYEQSSSQNRKQATDAQNAAIREYANLLSLAEKLPFVKASTEEETDHHSLLAHEFVAEFGIKGRVTSALTDDVEINSWKSVRKSTATTLLAAEKLAAAVFDRLEVAARVRMEQDHEGMPLMAHLRRMLAAGASRAAPLMPTLNKI